MAIIIRMILLMRRLRVMLALESFIVTVLILVSLLPHIGVTELDERDCANNEKDDDRDGCRKSVVDAATGREGQVIQPLDRMSTNGIAAHGPGHCST